MRFATRDAALLELMFAGKHEQASDAVQEAASGALAVLFELIGQGQAEGILEPGEAGRVGLVLLATVQGIAAVVNGGIVNVARWTNWSRTRSRNRARLTRDRVASTASRPTQQNRTKAVEVQPPTRVTHRETSEACGTASARPSTLVLSVPRVPAPFARIARPVPT